VQIPLALPTIMAGLNQTIMMALSMVVIAALIGAGGLGAPVIRGLNSLDIGLATIGGLSIVLVAIVLDRITQSLGKTKQNN
jgi:glycine betaine/proline transport system permease protein